MEHVGSLADQGEWGCSLSGMYNTTEEADFMAQLLANPPLPSNLVGCSGLGDHSFWSACQESEKDMTLGIHKSLCSAEMATNPSMFYFLQGSSSIHSGNFSSFLPTPTMSSGNYFLNDSHAIHVSNDSHMGMEFCSGDGKITSSYLAEENECMNQEKPECNVDQESCEKQPESCIPDETSQDDKIPAVQVPNEPMEEHTTVSGNRKRPRIAEKNKRTVRSRRNQKRGSTGGNEENNAGKIGQTPSACCSDDDSNASQEHQGEPISPSDSAKDQPTALNSNGKSRASRGTATDPQSLYARKRRERINERLRILQGLVPNGTKVDISTMLEEAVQYVKFLQLQIKLLSSDDMWMYAPIAYNGMNLGLDLNIPTPPKRS